MSTNQNSQVNNNLPLTVDNLSNQTPNTTPTDKVDFSDLFMEMDDDGALKFGKNDKQQTQQTQTPATVNPDALISVKASDVAAMMERNKVVESQLLELSGFLKGMAQNQQPTQNQQQQSNADQQAQLQEILSDPVKTQAYIGHLVEQQVKQVMTPFAPGLQRNAMEAQYNQTAARYPDFEAVMGANVSNTSDLVKATGSFEQAYKILKTAGAGSGNQSAPINQQQQQQLANKANKLKTERGVAAGDQKPKEIKSVRDAVNAAFEELAG